MARWADHLKRITPQRELRYTGVYTGAWLDQWRGICDPLADDAYEALRLRGRRGGDMLAEIEEMAASPEEPGNSACRALLDEVNQVPAWVDFERMEAGRLIITSYTAFYGLSLLCGSLVGGAIFVKQALVTASTGRLSSKGGSNRRIEETAAMIKALALKNELKPGGKAHRTIVKVRVLHSAIRHWLRATERLEPEWDEPICQEDLAITLSLFSYTNIRSLLRLGVHLSRDQIDSHHHMWRYVGWLLGIREELLTDSIEQEKILWDAFLKHAARPELIGPQVKDVLDAVAEASPRAPERVKHYLYEMTRYLAGDDYVAGFDLPKRRNYLGIPASRLAGYATSQLFHRIPMLDARWAAFAAQRFIGQMDNLGRSRGMDYDVSVERAEDPALRSILKAITEKIGNRLQKSH